MKVLKIKKNRFKSKGNMKPIFHFADEVGSFPADYDFVKYDNQIIKDAKRFLSQTNVDLLNEGYFDKEINQYLDLVINDLYRQKVNHQRTIISLMQEKLVRIKEYQEVLENIEKELSNNEKEMNDLWTS